MPTNLAIDDKLLEEARRLGKMKTKRETVNHALREFIARQKRLRAVQHFGTIDFNPAWDHKKMRRR
jgi:Arc/MetJ family transcription regulator